MTYRPETIVVVLLVLVALVALAWRRVRVARHADQLRQVNEAYQALALAHQDEITALMADTGLSVDEVETRAASILAAMEAIDGRGVLAPLIEDNRSWIAEECARRRERAQ